MAMVRVYNDNVFPYDEVFKDEKIHIEPKGYIEMDENEAIQFRGTYKAPVLNADGVHMPQGFKMIRVQKIADSEAPKIDEFQCVACKYKADSKDNMNEHLKTHKDQTLVDEEAEAMIKARKKKIA